MHALYPALAGLNRSRSNHRFGAPTVNVRDLRVKYEAFGWHAVDVDGHDVEAIYNALDDAKKVTDRPSAIVCHTKIGKGVSFMEDQAGWHGVAPNDEQAAKALAELGAA